MSTAVKAIFVWTGLVAVAHVSYSQTPSFGIIGGTSLTSGFPNSTEIGSVYNITTSTQISSNSHDYLVGGMVEIRLPVHLSIEVDALYRPLNFSSFTSSVPESGRVSSPGNTVLTWEFPVLGKYSFWMHREAFVRPFLEAGPSFRVSGNLNDTSPSKYGVAAGAGLEMHLLKLKVGPALRYTHWVSDPAPSIPLAPHTRQNQLELLVGLSF